MPHESTTSSPSSPPFSSPLGLGLGSIRPHHHTIEEQESGKSRKRRSPSPKKALFTFVQSFLLAYGLRAGVSLVLRLVKLLTRRKQNMKKELMLAMGVEPIRFGLFIGGFSGLYQLSQWFLPKIRGHASNRDCDCLTPFLAGCIAGTTILFEHPEQRRTIALYLLVRSIQSTYNAAKSRGWWHFWAEKWDYGDTLLFVLSCGQIMYAYALRPETIPSSYYKFIRDTGPIAEVVLAAVRKNIRGEQVDTAALVDFCHKHGGEAAVDAFSQCLRTGTDAYGQVCKYVGYLPCATFHPKEPSCFLNGFHVLSKAIKKIIPIYLSVHFVPMIVLRTKKLLSSPHSMVLMGIWASIRSSLFLTVFVVIYQWVVCLHRKMVVGGIFKTDWKYLYFISGMISGLSILIEKKSRRSELALYALPRAGDAFFLTAIDRKWVCSLPYGEVLLFCLSMGCIMYFYEHETPTLTPLLAKLLEIFISPSISSTPPPSPNPGREKEGEV